MLAKDVNFDKLRFPLKASPKLDGVRATVINGVVMSRSLKPIPNKYIQSQFGNCEYFDGELIVGDPTSKTVYRDTVSEVMAHDRTNGCSFYVFDHIQHPGNTYKDRLSYLKNTFFEGFISDSVVLLGQQDIQNMAELLDYEELCLSLGYEGLIVRSPDGHYKYGRSSVNEGLLLKIKRMSNDEAEIIGFEEKLHNANEAQTNELGRTFRSSAAAGKIPAGTLGALNVKFKGVEFSVGSGFDDAERKHIWDNKSEYLGKLISFNHFTIGAQDKPRFPVYKGLRNLIDL